MVQLFGSRSQHTNRCSSIQSTAKSLCVYFRCSSLESCLSSSSRLQFPVLPASSDKTITNSMASSQSIVAASTRWCSQVISDKSSARHVAPPAAVGWRNRVVPLNDSSSRLPPIARAHSNKRETTICRPFPTKFHGFL